MKAKEFIDSVITKTTEQKLKIVDKDGNWCDIGLDEEIPEKIYGYAIYSKAKFPTSFIGELKESGLVSKQDEITR